MRVVNASPLIHLARVSLLELLRGEAQVLEVVVPSEVFEEVTQGARHDSSAALVQEAARDWLVVVPPSPAHFDSCWMPRNTGPFVLSSQRLIASATKECAFLRR